MDLKNYIKGNRHGKMANKMEKKAMNDPFLQDAIDGYDSVPGDHFSTIEKLEERLAPQPNRINKRVWMWVAAAVLVLLIGIPFLLRQPDIKDVQVASTEPAKQEEAVVLSPQKDTVLVADNIEKETKKPAPPSPPAIPQVMEIRVAEEVEPVQEMAAKAEPIQTAQEVGQVKISRAMVASNTKTVSGKIVDEKGEPIIGGTVMVKNAKEGTVSDIDGNFRLVVPKNEEGTLIASYVGMENKEIPLKENVGNIVMKEDTELLSEVVVVGFGTQRKTSTVGSISKAKEEISVFGEAEFKKYFEENYDKTICANEPISVKVEFFVNAQGQPGNIVIKENSCPELETEIKRLLLGSPKWSQTNRKITLEITFNE